MTAVDDAPYLVTLTLDEASQTRFDDLRRRYFPPERLVVGAHLTLFHKLPAAEGVALLDDCAAEARRTSFVVRSVGVRLLGRGVAIDLQADELTAVHAALSARWRPWLSPQDRQPFRPHVTVQNKVDPALARATAQALGEAFSPAEHRATGIDVWRYRGGPWEHVRLLPFAER